MKRLLLPILLACALWLACPFSVGTGAGSQVDTLLSDPQVGLDGLDNYRATLNISFKGTLDGQPVDLTDTYVQTEWPGQAAKFTSMDTTDDSGERQVILTGAVGEAQYFQVDSSSPCTVDWGAAAGGPSEFRPAFFLPAVGAAKLAGEQTMDGIATRHYTFEAASLGLPADTTVTGEAWIAKDGGYVMKYMLEISGADSFFGAGAQGTRRVEYFLSEVDANPEVVYPSGCEPVLTDMLAMDDATDLTRLPGLLAYNTNATADDIFSFYVDKLTSTGWEKISDYGQGTDSATAAFTRTDTGAVAFVGVKTEGSTRRVTVMIPGQEPAATATTVPGTTPGTPTSPYAGTPSVRVVSSLNILLGMDTSQPAPPSYHLESIHQSPVWAGGKIAQRQDAMSADVQGKDVHFTYRTTTPGGTTTTSEVYLIGDQEYDVENGQVQPPGPSMKALAWSSWPLDPAAILATGATDATAAGTEVLEGRIAEVYELNGTGSALSGVSGMGLPVTSVSGKVWVDQQTGALLKAVLDYQANVRDAAGNDKGSGSGHLEITVTQVGQVTVALPGH